MDENSGNTTDKRNWRERLGIGKTAGSTDLPKLSGDFKPVDKTSEVQAAAVPRPGTARPATHIPVKAAPMAPRPAAKPATAPSVPAAAGARPAAAHSPPIASENLAAKLRDQREAAEKLAIQRVQAAKQKAEATLITPVAGKPKFTFADEAAGAAPAAASPVARPVQPAPQPAAAPRPAQVQPPQPAQYTPQQQPTFQPQMQPPRPPLGTNPGYALPPGYSQQGPGGYVPPQQPQYQPQQYQPQQPYANPGFGQQPNFRPIDPQTGYVPPPGFNSAARPGFQPQQPGANPRGGAITQRTGFQPVAQPNARLANPPRGPQLKVGPASGGVEGESDDVFEPSPVRAPRRATANEYQQAYRDEMAFDDEAPRSSKLGVILGLVLLGLLTAFGAIYAYSHYAKTQHVAAGANVPVVAAPLNPTKVVPDSTAAGQPADSGKKLIYDRIEGDHEVLGGQLKSNEEVPLQPQSSGTNIAPAGTAPQPATGDGTPLPLPPPPGATTGQQGALTPDGKTDIANITPAAEQSSAANSSAPAAANAPLPVPPPPPGDTAAKVPPPPAVVAPTSASPPAPSGIAADKPLATLSAEKLAAAANQSATGEAIDNTPAQPAVVAPVKKPDALKKLVLGKHATKSLGAKPLVLVPPAKVAPAPVVVASNQTLAPAPTTSADNSLYGDAPVVTPPATKQPTTVATAAPLKPIAAAPATPVVATGAYVVQLASFASKADASAEYQRLAAKHGAIITRYAPIIQAAQVAGSTRFRLNLGPMTSNDVASSVCSSLIAAGERDCLVRRQ